MNALSIRTAGTLAAACLCAVAGTFGTHDTAAAETRIALPAGFGLTSTEGVATTEDRHAFAISERGTKTTSRVMQVAGSQTVFTDLEGMADWVEYSADRTHLLVRQSLPDGDPRRGSHLYSLIDSAGQVVWSTESKAAYRFTGGGNYLYVAQHPGDRPHIRVFDLRGNLIRSVEPKRPYLDARVLDDGAEAVVLFSTLRSRSTDSRGGRAVTVERIRLEEPTTVVWRVPLAQEALKYPELIPMDRDWLLITTEQGFVAVHRDGETTRFGSHTLPGGVAGANLSTMGRAPGATADSLVLFDADRTLMLDLKAGDLTEIEPDPGTRFADVGYRDRHLVLVRPGEVILKSLEEHPATGAVRRKRSVGRKDLGGRQKR